VLTDGSGHTQQSRLPLTTRIIKRAHARPCAPYGVYTDATLYQAICERRFWLFAEWAEELASALCQEQITHVVGDAADGYNPGHDVCRLLINAAVEIVWRTTGKRLANYDFPLLGRPDALPERGSFPSVWLRLSEEEFADKVAAAQGYGPLKADVEAAVASIGLDAFRIECLRPVPDGTALLDPIPTRPYYESQGGQRVAAGQYVQVLRYRRHMVPLIESLTRYLEGFAPCAPCAC
jgi:hypothetical protein